MSPGLPAGLVRIIERAMRPRPADRYRSAEEMMLELEALLRTQDRAAGQSPLQAWLGELARRDQVPPISRAPALPAEGAKLEATGDAWEELNLEGPSQLTAVDQSLLTGAAAGFAPGEPRARAPGLRWWVAVPAALLGLAAAGAVVTMSLPRATRQDLAIRFEVLLHGTSAVPVVGACAGADEQGEGDRENRLPAVGRVGQRARRAARPHAASPGDARAGQRDLELPQGGLCPHRSPGHRRRPSPHGGGRAAAGEARRAAVAASAGRRATAVACEVPRWVTKG